MLSITDLSCAFVLLAGSNAVFNLQQFAAAAREFIGEWGGGDEVRDFIASSAQPGFGHWQPDADAGTQRSPETTTTAAPDQVSYYM